MYVCMYAVADLGGLRSYSPLLAISGHAKANGCVVIKTH